MKLRACAKINLGLHILGKRPDGYHDIETVFHTIDLADDLELGADRSIRFACNIPSLSDPDDNLCVRAALALRAAAHIDAGASLTLTKRIPVGAGLGGGSSDAGAVLRGLNILWNLHYAPDKLRAIAATVGSDVPFFVEGGTAYATGRGERLRNIRLEIPWWIVTVSPPVHVSTAWAYGHVRPRLGTATTPLDRILEDAMPHPQQWAGALQNDFEPLVYEAHPDIRKVRDTLLAQQAIAASLSGSGSSVVGWYESESGARAAARSFPHPHVVSVTAPGHRPHESVH